MELQLLIDFTMSLAGYEEAKTRQQFDEHSEPPRPA